MGSKKHKKHKSERREREERSFSLDRPPSLKLILKVGGSSSTPEHGNDSPAYGIQSDTGMFAGEYPERHKKSKKKKKKKDREKKHKHHKEKRRHREDSSQEDFSLGGEDSSQQPPENLMFYSSLTTTNSIASSPVTKPFIAMRSPEPEVQPLSSKYSFLPSSVGVLDDSLMSPLSLQSPLPCDNLDLSANQKMLEAPKTPNSADSSGREPRTCVLKLKQSRTPLAKLLDHLLKGLEKRDPHQFFAWPVTDDIAPGYSTIITKPMDFSTIRQRIDDTEYTTVSEFSDDFKLMCENAIKYNHSETVYHKAAKKLLHVGARLLQPDNLLRSLRPLMVYMRELTSKELGFELPTLCENQENEHHNMDSADEAVAAAVDEGINAHIEEDEKRKQLRLDNNPTSKFEAFVDDLTPDEVLEQVQAAAMNAKNRIHKKRSAHKMGFLRQLKDGTTTMKILLDNENEGPEKMISLGAFTGKLQQGTGQLQGFREDRRNAAKIVKPLNYGAFSSFAPIFDSRFSNLSKEESDLVLNTYGDETGAEYAESMMGFSKDSPYASILANGLLDLLTNGEHRKTLGTLVETQRQKNDEEAVHQIFPDNETEDDYKKYANVKIDFDALRTLSNIGLDIQFIDELEFSIKMNEMNTKLQESLNSNSNLIHKLHQMQNDRLSAPLPAHLSHVQAAGISEIQLANRITSNLTDIAKQLPPIAISSPHAIRKAMGMSNVGLESFQQPPVGIINPQPQLAINANASSSHSNSGGNDIIDTTPMDMDLEPEPIRQSNRQVDIDNELREFLDSGLTTSSNVEHDTSIEHMLM